MARRKYCEPSVLSVYDPSYCHKLSLVLDACIRSGVYIYWCILLTGLLSTSTSSSPPLVCSECQNGRKVKVSSPIGHISPTAKLPGDGDCITWQIQNVTAGDSKVSLSFDNFNLNPSPDGTCSDGYVCIGPEPNHKMCRMSRPGPMVLSSLKDHMWVSLVRKSNWANSFSLTYRIDKTCGPGTFQCTLRSTSRLQCLRNTDHRRCDGYRDCIMAEDENDCDKLMCDDKSFKCKLQNKLQCVNKRDSRHCDGIRDCHDGEDENNCNPCGEKYVEGPFGFITTPNYPKGYPNYQVCEWHIHVTYSHQIQIRFLSFELEDSEYTDYLVIYDGGRTTDPLLGTYHGSRVPKFVVTSSNRAVLVFHSDKTVAERGFNISYQRKGFCYGNQIPCGWKEDDCYDPAEQCDETWDCQRHGGDESGCGPCEPSKFRCGKDSNRCYSEEEHCNGMSHCLNNKDEEDCNSVLCGTHNGTFLCNNRHCIYENWQCDGTDDCQDNSDELNCSVVSSVRVITAAVIGALICAILLVIALGCTCKLYALRLQENSPNPSYDSPQTRLQQEFFIHRQAPPPYNEALTTSRPFDEAQREFMEQVFIAANRRNRQRRRQSRPPSSQHNTTLSNEDDNSASNPVTTIESESAEVDPGQRVQTGQGQSLPLISIRRPDTTISDDEDIGAGDNESSDVNLSLAADMRAQWRRTGANSSRDRVGNSPNPEQLDDVLSDNMDMELMHDETATEVASIDTASGSIDSTVMPLQIEQPIKNGDTENRNERGSHGDINMVPEVKVLNGLHRPVTRIRHRSNGSEISSEGSNSSELLGSLENDVDIACDNVDDIITIEDDVPLLSP